MRLTLKKTKEREELVKGWIKEGKTINDMAQLLGVRPEAVRKFLKVREWETHGMRDYRLQQEAESGKASKKTG